MTYVESAVRSRQLVAAARVVLVRDGVARTSMRAVAAEANVPLGTLQYVFPSKQKLLHAVIEDLVTEIETTLRASAELDSGLASALRHGLRNFWAALVAGERNLQVVQYELVTYALRTPGQEALARWQYERYIGVVAEWCSQAADRAGETCAVPFPQLARVTLAAVDGLIVQSICDPNEERSAADLELAVDMITGMAGIHPAGA